MTIEPIKAVSPVSQSEMEAALDIYAALCQYRAQHTHLSDNIYFMEALRQSHAHWAMLMGGAR